MKKTLRFAALAAVMSLTFWLAKVDDAQAAKYPRCSVLHGGFCTGGSTWCSLFGDGYPDGYCVCSSGHWDCGCDNGITECY